MEFVDTIKSFPTRIWSQKSASIQPRTNWKKCVLGPSQKIHRNLVRNFENFEIGAVRRCVNRAVLEKCWKMRPWLQKSASIQPRTILPKFQGGSEFHREFHIRIPPRRWRPAFRTLRGVSGAVQASGLNKLFIFSKLREARCRLYRRRFLQPNTNFSAFCEIYKSCNPLH